MDSVYKIAVIGLGYVGLPLAIEFANNYKVLGFDLDQPGIEELPVLEKTGPGRLIWRNCKSY